MQAQLRTQDIQSKRPNGVRRPEQPRLKVNAKRVARICFQSLFIAHHCEEEGTKRHCKGYSIIGSVYMEADKQQQQQQWVNEIIRRLFKVVGSSKGGQGQSDVEIPDTEDSESEASP